MHGNWDLYLRALSINFYEKFISSTFVLFLLLLSGLEIVQGTFSATLPASKLYELSLWIIEHILQMSRNVSINLYLKFCSIAIYGKFYLYCLCHLRDFSGLWIVKNLVYKVCITFWKCEDRQALFILECI